MSTLASHHYVAEMYLKRFTEECLNKQLAFYDKENPPAPGVVPTRAISKLAALDDDNAIAGPGDHYDATWEDDLSLIETQAEPAFHAMVGDLLAKPPLWPTPPRDREAISRFIASQILRVPDIREYVIRGASQKYIVEHRGESPPITMDDLHQAVTPEMLGNFTRVSRAGIFDILRAEVDSLSVRLNADFAWQIKRAASPCLLTSSDPVVCFPADQMAESYGPLTSGVICLPLDRRQVLVLVNSAVHNTGGALDDSLLTPDQARELNEFTAGRHARYLYYHPEDSLFGGPSPLLSPSFQIPTEYKRADGLAGADDSSSRAAAKLIWDLTSPVRRASDGSAY
jgi:hypothetical protein